MKNKLFKLPTGFLTHLSLTLLLLLSLQRPKAQTCSPPTQIGCLNAGLVTLQSGGQGSTSLAVTWTQMSGNVGYYVDCTMANSPFSCTSATTLTNVNTYTFTGLTPNTTYNIRYIAKCTSTTWGWSSTTAAFTTSSGGGGGSCSPPTEIGCLNAGTVSLQSGGQGSTSLAVTWTQMSGNVGYYVDCKMVNSPFTCISATTLTNVNTYTFTGLTPNTSYTIRYIAKCSPTTWGWSSAFYNFSTSSSCTLTGVSANPQSHTAAGQALVWSFNSTGAWTATDDQSWITVTASGSAGTPTSATITTAVNTGAARSGTVTISCGGSTLNVTVNQAAGNTCTLTGVSTNPQSHTAAGQALAWSFNSTSAWTALDDQTWITVTSSGSAGTPASATITTTANTGAAARSGTVTITCGVSTLNVTVNQAAPSGTCVLAAPSGVSYNSVTQFSANVAWTGTVAGASRYRVHYRKVGWANFLTSDTPNGASLSLALSNLECGASYEYKVQSICANNVGGTFSAQNTFATTACSTCTGTAFSSNAASNLTNLIDLNVGPSVYTYDLPYIFGVNRNFVKNRFDSYDANYYTFIQSLLKKYGTNISKSKLYRHGGTMTDGHDGLVNCYGMSGWRHSVHDSQDGPYPYDKLSNYTDEAGASYLNADLTVTVNFGSGTPYDAGQLVLKLKNAAQLPKVKYFEMGNEITLPDQFGNGSRTSHYGECITCTYNASDIDCYPTASTVYDLNDKCSSPALYAEKVAAFIKEMVTQAGAGNKLKVGLVLGHDTEMKGANLWANEVNTNMISIMNKLKSLIGSTAPNQADNIENQVDLFFTFHGYGGWPILNGLQDPGPGTPGYDDAAFARGIFAAPYHAEKRIRDLIYSNLSCKTDKVFGNPAYLWNNKPIKLGITEYSTYMHSQRSSLHYTVTEALFSADNMLNAMKMELEMSVAYGIFHDDPNAADNLFFDSYNSGVTYSTSNLSLIGEKCTYKLHDFLDQYLYNKVIGTYDGASTLYKVTNFPLRDGSGQSASNYAYPALSFAITQNGSANEYAMVVLNRSDVTQKATNLFLTALPSGTYSAVKHTLKANSVQDLQFLTPADSTLTAGTAVSGGKLTLPNLFFPKLSVSIITFTRISSLKGGGTGGSVNRENSDELTLYPNPANSEITLLTPGNETEDATIVIHDLVNRPIKVIKTQLVEGMNEHKIDISDIPAGVYSVTVWKEKSNQKLVVKFVKSVD